MLGLWGGKNWFALLYFTLAILEHCQFSSMRYVFKLVIFHSCVYGLETSMLVSL